MSNEPYKSNGTPLTPIQAELLTILMEECAEVIQAASKLIRFGVDDHSFEARQERILPGRVYLGREVGDVFAMVEACKREKLIDQNDITEGICIKQGRLDRFRQNR